MIRHLAMAEGQSQKDLSKRLGILPSRLVVLVDELEAMSIVERRMDPEDRRSHQLYLTDTGHAMMGELRKIAKDHSSALAEAYER